MSGVALRPAGRQLPEAASEPYGSCHGGTGQPSRPGAVSHGGPASRGRGVNVMDTGRSG
ncbi:MAG: hypothetical protein JWL60_1093 [Gemmatimonadetes bacterium]|jgi:hypothetical protein|nr:hypothetical protein [Gemmatimonadota bacterium]